MLILAVHVSPRTGVEIVTSEGCDDSQDSENVTSIEIVTGEGCDGSEELIKLF